MGRAIVPPERVRYLAEISEAVRGYHRFIARQARIARERQALRHRPRVFLRRRARHRPGSTSWSRRRTQSWIRPRRSCWSSGPTTQETYAQAEYVAKIRDREIRTELTYDSLSGTRNPQSVSAALRG